MRLSWASHRYLTFIGQSCLYCIAKDQMVKKLAFRRRHALALAELLGNSTMKFNGLSATCRRGEKHLENLSLHCQIVAAYWGFVSNHACPSWAFPP